MAETVLVRPLRRGTETFDAHNLDGSTEVLADHIVFERQAG